MSRSEFRAMVGGLLANVPDATWMPPVGISTPPAPKHGRPSTRGKRHRSLESRANRRKAKRRVA